MVIATHNRLRELQRAVESVLTQAGQRFELIIVDDGSSDGTGDWLAQLSDDRVTTLTQENRGPGAARNTGISSASGDWTVFLDDDDWVLPDWLATFASLVGPETAVVCCGAEYITRDGEVEYSCPPWQLGSEFGFLVANTLAGAFAVRTEILRSIGGFDERLTSSEQTELWLRIMPAVVERGMDVQTTDTINLRIEQRPLQERPMSNPAAVASAIDLLLEKHGDLYASNPKAKADLYGVLGVSAARMGRWSEARSALFTSVTTEPLNLRRWVRLFAALVPPLGRRQWDTKTFDDRPATADMDTP